MIEAPNKQREWPIYKKKLYITRDFNKTENAKNRWARVIRYRLKLILIKRKIQCKLKLKALDK